MKKIFTSILILISIGSYSQESKDPMSIYFASNIALYSFDEISYIKDGSDYKTDNQSTFYPELGVEVIFNKEGRSKHGLSLNYRFFTMLYNIKANDFSILPSLYKDGDNLVFSTRQNFHNIGLSYKYYMNFNNLSSLFLGATLNWDYNSSSTGIPIETGSHTYINGIIETHTGLMFPNPKNPFPNFLSFQIGYKYNINKKFEIGAFIDYKPFSELVASDEITRSEGDEILKYTKIEQYKKYLIFSFSIKYRLDFK